MRIDLVEVDEIRFSARLSAPEANRCERSCPFPSISPVCSLRS
jgi:hypothetical protein